MAHAADETGDPRFAAPGARRAGGLHGGRRSRRRAQHGRRAPRPDAGPLVRRAGLPGRGSLDRRGALNGFMVTLLNLRGAAALLDRVPGGDPVAATGAALARDLADRGAASLVRHLPDHDTGAWSYYGLLTRGPALADPPRRPQLPLLPRPPARPAGRALPGHGLRRDGRPLAGLRRRRRPHLPGALSASGAPSAARSGATRAAARRRDPLGVERVADAPGGSCPGRAARGCGPPPAPGSTRAGRGARPGRGPRW